MHPLQVLMDPSLKTTGRYRTALGKILGLIRPKGRDSIGENENEPVRVRLGPSILMGPIVVAIPFDEFGAWQTVDFSTVQ